MKFNNNHARIQCVWGGGGTGVQTPPPLKNHKNIGFPRNTGLDPLKIQCWPTYSGIWILPPLIYLWQNSLDRRMIL